MEGAVGLREVKRGNSGSGTSLEDKDRGGKTGGGGGGGGTLKVQGGGVAGGPPPANKV